MKAFLRMLAGERPGRLFSKLAHVLIASQFAAKDLGFFVKLNAGISHGYKSTLAKQFFNDGFDWGVWHFNGDLPLPLDAPRPLLVQTRVSE